MTQWTKKKLGVRVPSGHSTQRRADAAVVHCAALGQHGRGHAATLGRGHSTAVTSVSPDGQAFQHPRRSSDRYDAPIMTATSGPTALITGVGGQDGIYLARFLLDRGYRVVGTVRPHSSRSADRLVYLAGIEILELDMLQREDFA